MKNRVKKVVKLLATSVLALPFLTSFSNAATTFTDRSAFEQTLGSSITDDYEDPGYTGGATYPFFDDATMSAVLGQTDYRSTAFSDNNIVSDYGSGNHIYCAGCNGTFELGFTTTSVGSSDGVYGVGFNYRNSGEPAYLAFVTFGDGSTENFSLGLNSGFETFFGLTSDTFIKSVHIGLVGGGTTFYGNFQIDNLTIGAVSVIPLPAGLPLFGAGLAIVSFISLRRSYKLQA